MKRACAIGLAALTASAVVGCTDGASQGDRVVPAAGSVALEGEEVEVWLPSGQFTFTVGDARDELAEGEVDDGEAREAPDGQSYVGVRWDWEGMNQPLVQALQDTPPQAGTVALDTGDAQDEVFELDTQSPGEGVGGTAWVLASDEGETSLAVTYDGHTQTVDLASGEVDTGVAAGYYDLVAGRDPRCPARGPGRTQPGLQYRIDCTIPTWSGLPYVAGRGWAAEGNIWLLMAVELRPGDFEYSSGSEEADYRVTRQEGSVRIGDREAETLHEEEQMASGHVAGYVVEAPADGPWKLQISHTYDLDRDGSAPGAPSSPRVLYHSTVTLGS